MATKKPLLEREAVFLFLNDFMAPPGETFPGLGRPVWDPHVSFGGYVRNPKEINMETLHGGKETWQSFGKFLDQASECSLRITRERVVEALETPEVRHMTPDFYQMLRLLDQEMATRAQLARTVC